jgi:hypothetical protein
LSFQVRLIEECLVRRQLRLHSYADAQVAYQYERGEEETCERREDKCRQFEAR